MMYESLFYIIIFPFVEYRDPLFNKWYPLIKGQSLSLANARDP